MNNNGFTLVELLITIAIIGILSSVTMVSLSSARDKAKDTSVQTTMTNLHYAFVMCDQGPDFCHLNIYPK